MGRGNPKTLEIMEDNNNPAINPELAGNDGADKGNNEPNAPENTPSPKPKEAPKFTKRERLIHAKSKIESELAELETSDDDNRPLTVGEYKKMQQGQQRESAIEVAASIDNEDERNEVIELLSTRLVPTGNAQEDVRLARDIVNAERNRRILEETGRKGAPQQHANVPGAPGKPEEIFTPTQQEQYMMQSFGLSKEQIMKARQAEREKQGN